MGFIVGGHSAFESIKEAIIRDSLIVLAFLGGLLGGSDILGLISNYIKGKQEKKKQERADKLKEINDQLDKIYRPMYDMVKDFQKKFCLEALPYSNSRMIEKINELETAFEEIKRNSDYEIDDKIRQIKVRVCFSLSEQGLSVLLGAINDKINELKSEKRKY